MHRHSDFPRRPARTAIVTVAALLNALKLTDKKLEDLTVVFSGAGAAGVAIAKLLNPRIENIIMCGRKGIISREATV